ncbi:MAG: alcohol dehydrogenase [Nitrospirae bacterium]|nr:MAG: alcohol dehydrogenase [Nitrospirota bacterium]
MHAVTFHEHGGLEQLRFEPVPVPEPRSGEVLVRVKACALNHLDIWIRQGIPAYHVPLPHISGCDVAGTIERVGGDQDESDLQSLAPGQPVVISPGLSCWRCEFCLSGRDNLCPTYKILGAQVNGGYAEFVVVPIRNVLPIPRGLTFVQAAACPLVSVTAWHMVMTLAQVEPTECVLVMGGGSGVGSMAIQLAKAVGARVLTTVGARDKVEKAKKLGADEVIDHSTEDIAQRVRELTDGHGVEVVLDHIGQRVWQACLRSLVRGGRFVTCGATTGGDLPLDARFLFSRQLTLKGAYMGTRGELVKAMRLIAAGTIRPVVDRVLPLREAAAAQQLMLDRKIFGKVVLKITDDAEESAM